MGSNPTSTASNKCQHGARAVARFGHAGSLSGYFAPIESQVPARGKPGNPPVDVNVLGPRRTQARRRARAAARDKEHPVTAHPVPPPLSAA